MRKWMFNDLCCLTESVINRTKWKTRRDAQKVYLDYESGRRFGDFPTLTLKEYALRKCPYKVGDIVAVAQSYHALNISGFVAPEWCEHTCESSAGYNNKMFVKPELMPYRVRITDIDFERLQDISDEDCLAEGIIYDPRCVAPYGYKISNGKSKWYRTPQDAFSVLIDKVCGKGTWERNHYVYVYTFELVKE